MSVAALITWLITAVGGFVLLGTWLTRGGARRGSQAPASASSTGQPGVTAPTNQPGVTSSESASAVAGARTPSTDAPTAGTHTSGAPAAGTTATATRLRPPLIFGHFLLAVAGLVVWIIYLVTDSEVLSWVAFVLLVVVALLGLTMFARWVTAGDHRRSTAGDGRPESHFPLAVVAGHGVFAVATVVLVLLTALGVGES